MVPLTGLPSQLEHATREAAYRGISAFILIRLIETGIFSDADIVDELTFSGMRPTSQHRLLAGAAYIGSKPERDKLRAALERFYAAGMISDNDLVGRLQSAEHNTDRLNLTLETVQLEKQIALAK